MSHADAVWYIETVHIAGADLKLVEKQINIEFPEGLLNIDWKEDNNVYMTGNVSNVKKITVSI